MVLATTGRLAIAGRAVACAAAQLALAACSDMGWTSGRSGTSGSSSGSASGWSSGSTGMNSGGSAAANDESMGTRSTTPEANIPTQQ